MFEFFVVLAIAATIATVAVIRNGPLRHSLAGITLPAVNWAKIISLVLIALALGWVWWWWPETAPGKAWISFLGLKPESEWYNWGVRYPLMGILLITGLQVLRNKPVGGGWTIPTIVVISLMTLGPLYFSNATPGGVAAVAKLDGEKLHAPSSDSLGLNGVMTIGLGDTMVHATAQHPRADGQTIYLGCAKIVRPDDPRMPKPHIIKVPRVPSYLNELRLNPKVIDFLVSQGITKVEVHWYTIESRTQNPVCPDGLTVWR